jgi:hypothetical protein
MTKNSESPWGEASEARGLAHLAEAIKFVAQFPIGTKLIADEFDLWAHTEGLLQLPFGQSKTSDAWKVHVQRRHKVREKINVSSLHPRLLHEGSTPFVIDWLGRDMFEVNSPERSSVVVNPYSKILQILETTKEQIARRFQAADFDAQPAHLRALAEQMFDDVDDVAMSFSATMNHKLRRIDKLTERMEFHVSQREQAKLESRPAPDLNEHKRADVG